MRESQIVAIVNVTPDSFSDGGRHYDASAAINAIANAIDDGARVIDIGAESTRPGAAPVTAEEEWARLEPVLAALPLFAMSPVAFSLDTRHAQTARRGLEAGVHWINDVSGFADTAMVDTVLGYDCRLVVMHSLGVPADKTVTMPEMEDAVEALLGFAQARIAQLLAAGIAKERIVFDPGIGFGKSAMQCWAVLRRIGEFKRLGVPLLVGHSRKSFLAGHGDRDEATIGVSQYLAQAGVDYLRVHTVKRHAQMLDIVKELTGGRPD
jgi:dihydropteroate synthase